MQHTREHFERENSLMQEHGIPANAIHSGEHKRVLAELKAVCAAWNEQGELEPLAHYVWDLWPGWFEQHVQTMDAMTAQFLSLYIPQTEE